MRNVLLPLVLVLSLLSCSSGQTPGEITATPTAYSLSLASAVKVTKWEVQPSTAGTIKVTGDTTAAITVTAPCTVLAWFGKYARAIVLDGTPGPSPGPEPQPNPEPGPTPTPGKISASLVCDPTGLGSETSGQVAARVNKAARDYMSSKGFRWRVYTGNPLDETGKPAVLEQWGIENTKSIGKPALVIGEPGKTGTLYSGQVTDDSGLLAALKKYGGPAAQPLIPQPELDTSELKVDKPDVPAGKSMGLIPIRPRRGMAALDIPRLPGAHPWAIPENQWFAWYSALPKTVLSEWVPEILNQNGLGACASFAATQAVMVAEQNAGLEYKPLCAFGLYAQVAYPRDSGSGLDENANTVATVGIPEIGFSSKFQGTGGWSNPSSWPSGWQANAARHKCSVIDIGGNSTAEGWQNLVSFLLRGIPCTVGVDWPGGHSILAVAPVFTGQQATGILIVNSWGPDDGDNGRYVRSKSNIQQGMSMFGGPFAYVVPTFPSDTKAEPSADEKPCPTGACPWIKRSELIPPLGGLSYSPLPL